MSDLHTARLAIEAELARAEQGLQFYKAQVESLKTALAGLAKVEEGFAQALRSGETKKKPDPASHQTSSPRAVERARRESRMEAAKVITAGILPVTGSHYWLQYITDQPRTAVEIAQAAIDAMEFHPTQEQIRVLKQRVAPSLETLVKSKRVNDSGAGRSRRFFLAPALQSL
jgi:hypothetical protein